ncbi:MAG: ABC transporter ATP-binding protein [Deltaproteobacteria bacterium]|nr:ABC transporter ATP-binding protein [Deltaproteobacteria bacterium]
MRDGRPGDTARGGGIGRLYSVLWTHARGMRGRLVLAIAMLVTAQVIRLAIPFFFGCAVNALQEQGKTGVVHAGWYLLAMLGAATAAWLLHGPARVIERRVALHARENLADALFARLLSLPLRWHEQHHSGDTLHRLQNTTAALFGFAQNQFIYLQNIVNIIGPIVALVAVSAITGVTALVGYTAVAIVLLRFDRVMMRLVREENAAERRYTATVVDAVGNIGTILTLGLAAPVRSLVRARNLDISVPLQKDFVLNEGKWAAVDLLNNAMRVGLVALYAWLAWRSTGAILVGTAVMVHQYAQQIGNVVGSMAANWTDLVKRQTDIACADPILEATPKPFPEPDPAHAAWKTIRISGAVLRHPNGARGLDGIDLELTRGKRIAVVGGSGAGKSTLLRVLAGLYSADRIGIAIDGEPTALQDLATLAVLVPQEPEIFDAEVRANLTLGVPRDEADVTRVCDLACLGPVLDALPGGLAAQISERGANLSGGQRQRIALARGLLAAERASLVLLDEPTSSIDPVTEARIYEGVLASLGDACVVSAIHRLHLLPRFDTVVLLHAGRVVDAGTLDELLSRQPLFQDMWRGYTNEPTDGDVRAA